MRKYPPTVIAVAALALGPGGAVARAAPAQPSFSTDPALEPAFSFAKRDYTVRCTEQRVTVDLDVTRRWQGRVGARPFRSGRFSVHPSLAPGKAVTVTFRRRGQRDGHRFHARCLPPDFPDRRFIRAAPGGPRLFSIHPATTRYAAIINRDGVPVWWFDVGSPGFIAEILPDGTLALGPAVPDLSVQKGTFPIYSLTGRRLGVVRAARGLTADLHELRLLPNGNFLLAADLPQDHVDTTPYGGASIDDTVLGAQLQELTPRGRLVWSWDSEDHIGLDETPARWWPQVYGSEAPTSRLLHNDIIHINSVEAAGRHLLLSFRHLDAVFKISRRTGAVVWKLGGTRTAKSLAVVGDPYAYPLGGQHDARLQPDGTVTIYDNRTDLGQPPRAVRYRIDEDARTARLVESVSDPEIASSPFMGSARRLASGEWLVGWGGNGHVAGYGPTGRRLFDLETPTSAIGTYRATPVPPGAVGIRRLRQAMDNMSE